MSIAFSCSCGEPLNADEVQAGADVTCPRCGAAVRVPSAGNPQLLGYVSPVTGTATVTPMAIDMLRQTSPWVRIMSILMFIGAGFMLVAAALVLAVGLLVKRRGGDVPPMFLSCIYVPAALLYIAPAIFLWRFATHSKAFAITRHEQSLELALQAQKSFWKYVAITALIVIALYLLIIVVVIAIAILNH
jgi:hypothetical protein